MTGVPGGDVTLHAAITETLARELSDLDVICPLWDRGYEAGDVPCQAHQREIDALVRMLAPRLLAVLADRLPHTPPDQLADLIGGTVEHRESIGATPAYDRMVHRVATPWVPDSPPAAPEPQCTCYFTPRVLAPPCPRHPAAPEPRQDDPDPLADPEYVAWLKAGRPPHPLPAAPTEEPTPHA